ncbi:MAG: VOC family protein [Terracidiphilus sp.]
MQNRSVPTDTVLPHLVYRDVARATEWLSKVFGFTEHYRYGDPVSGVQMRLGEAVIMLHKPGNTVESPTTLGFGTQMLTVFVADVDAHYARSKQQGATIWEELHETIYGERQYGVKDLESHRWLFSQHARDVDPREWGANVA